MNLADILKDSNYKLSQFEKAEIQQLEQAITLKDTKNGTVPYTECLVRRKSIKLTPEEVIRQLYLRVLSGRLGYSLDRMRVEYGVNFGRQVKRADIVVMDKDRLNTVYILIEVKKPKLKDGKNQLRSYCHATGAPIAVWTNGDQISFYQRKDPNYFEDIPRLPKADETLEDVLKDDFTLEDLIANDKLTAENKSLKTLIEEMEDEVLANAGVDVFEELFKLIFTKLYDEWYAGQGKRRTTYQLEFRNSGQTEAALKTKIQRLFDKAKNKWEGVFSEDARISLTPSHLSVCVSSLEKVKLFNSNLDVIDEAFEYLINQSSKGDKGQYFTPRYVIDMCVKMLNPQEDEYMIDTAAGSSGFPVHTIFHVWRQIIEDEGLTVSNLFSLEEKPPRCAEYVEDKVFAIDFDEKAVRVARTLNLIAGDGQTNVLHLNTLDYELWNEVAEQEEWDNVYHSGFRRLRKLRPKGSGKDDYRDFRFDVLMANPPFAGDIKEPRMIARYGLARKPDGKWKTKVGRDILFIERNLDFLKPGGRMAIVLPQGRFNNSSDKGIRDFIAERCRILAVVGLHGNTFKPHTGTKTSVLFVQKWNDDAKAGALCLRREDYNIFFATMQKSGKDNSGDKIYVKTPDDSGGLLMDDHDHLIVDHDLYNHDGKTEDGIAEAFIEFAKKEELSFFESGPSVTPFDAVKYQRLMDGLEAVEIGLEQALDYNQRFRFDSEFFKKKYFQIEDTLRASPCARLSSVQPTIIHPTEIKREYVQNGLSGVMFFRTQNLRPLSVDLSNQVYISIEDAEKMHKNLILENDVLMTRTGANFGDTLIFNENVRAIASSHVFIIRNEKISQSFLGVFLNTLYGKEQINKGMYGGVQPEVAPYYLRNIIFPLLSSKFQELIEKLVQHSKVTIKTSKQAYQQAEYLLLSELGLKDWQPTEETVAVKSFAESFLSSSRLDAEYYQPKFDQLIIRLKEKVKLDSLGHLLTSNKKGRQPNYVEDETISSNELPVINSKYVREGEVVLSNNRYAYFPDDNNALIIHKDDVLFNGTGVGTVGRCAAYLHEQDALPDTEVTVLRSDTLDSIYLSIYLNSIAGQLQVQKHLQGSSGIIRVYPSDINQFLVWNAPKPIQQAIRSKVEISHHKREQSSQLLEIAKTGVERAIEIDEESAIAWINKQLKSLNIELD